MQRAATLCKPSGLLASAPEATAATTAQPWLLVSLIAATFLSLLHYAAFSPLLPAMAADLGQSVSLLGQVPATIALGAALLGPITGPLADRYGYGRAMQVGLLVLVGSAVGVAVAPSYPVLFLAAMVGTIGRATVYPVALAIAGTRFAGDEQRRAMSRVTASLSVAPVLGIPAVTAIATWVDWRAAFLVVGGVTAVVLLAMCPCIHGGAASGPASRMRGRDLLMAYSPLFRDRASLGLIAGTFLLGAGGWVVWTYLGAFLVQQHAFTTQQAGWAWTAVGLGLLVGTLVVAERLGRFSLRPLFVVAGLGVGVCMAAGLLMPLSGWLAVGVVAVGTVLHGVTQVTSTLLLVRESPVGKATTMTLRGSAANLGAAVGAATGGAAVALGDYPVLGLVALLYCVAGAGIAWWAGTRRAAPALAVRLAQDRSTQASAA